MRCIVPFRPSSPPVLVDKPCERHLLNFFRIKIISMIHFSVCTRLNLVRMMEICNQFGPVLGAVGMCHGTVGKKSVFSNVLLTFAWSNILGTVC